MSSKITILKHYLTLVNAYYYYILSKNKCYILTIYLNYEKMNKEKCNVSKYREELRNGENKRI